MGENRLVLTTTLSRDRGVQQWRSPNDAAATDRANPESNSAPNLDLRLRPSMSLARPWRLMGHSKGRVALPLTALTNLLLTACTMEVQTTGASIVDEPALC